MAKIASSALEIWVNDQGPFHGSLSIDTDMIDVTSDRDSYKPDPEWEYVDKAGHWHAFTSDGKHPTLERYEKPVPCDGSCGGVCGGEGTTETRYRCRACGKRVKPYFVVDVPAFTPQRIPGRTSWCVNVTAADAVADGMVDVSVRIVAADRMWFGLARRDLTASDGMTWTYGFHGYTELGERAP